MSCSVEGCKSRNIHKENEKESVRLHRFPKDEVLRTKWKDLVKRPYWIPNNNSPIFSKHFSEDSFVPSENMKWRRLKTGAKPTLNLPEETDMAEFYTYNNIGTLLAKCEEYKEKVFNCRTIGVLESLNGRFHLKDIDSKDDAPKIRVSMVYVKSQLPSTVIPYVVQVFGVLQWTSKPVIFAKIVQVLDTLTGIRLNEALKSITSIHIANQFPSSEL